MRYAITLNTVSPKAKVSLHDASCRNATKRSGLSVYVLPAGTTYDEALVRVEENAKATERKHNVCKCVNAKGPASLRDIFTFGAR